MLFIIPTVVVHVLLILLSFDQEATGCIGLILMLNFAASLQANSNTFFCNLFLADKVLERFVIDHGILIVVGISLCKLWLESYRRFLLLYHNRLVIFRVRVLSARL